MDERLTDRELDVLSIVVETYIESGAPVGSRLVAKKSRFNLSPATMRNVMADLTDKGFLKQPHTSAGRIPTKKGLRFYLNHILKPEPLFYEKKKIKEHFNNTIGYELSHILERTSKFISDETALVGIAVSPEVSFMKWKHIDFVLVKPGLIMAILVFYGGMVHSRMISLDGSKIDSNDLVKFSNFLNERFSGKPLFEVKKELLKEMEEARKKFNELYLNALTLAQYTCDAEDEREIFVEGTHNVIGSIEPRDVERMKSLLEYIEKRSEFLKILDKIGQGKGIFIAFGNELFDSDLGEWSIISSPYGAFGEPLGIIGTIGPIHMEYPKLIPMVDYMARMLSRILETRL
ncbi:heat-inducible transcriptional repressor HrcA [Desulfothermus okinawensis JCM 13304]